MERIAAVVLVYALIHRKVPIRGTATVGRTGV